MRVYLAAALAAILALAAVDIRPAAAAPIPNAGGPYAGQVGQPIQFSGANSREVVNYRWDFGDGTTAEGIMPVKTYNRAGVFTVTLTATDRFGERATATTTATISPTAGVTYPTTVVSYPSCATVLVNGVWVCAGYYGYPYGYSYPFYGCSVYNPYCRWGWWPYWWR